MTEGFEIRVKSLPYFLFLLICLFFACSDKKGENLALGTSAIERKMVLIPAGEFLMGSNASSALEDEKPQHAVKINSFWLDNTEVTNADFLEFVRATGYKTFAEKDIDWEEYKQKLPPNTPKPPDSLLKAASLVFYANPNSYDMNNYTDWWILRDGANWKHPHGPESSISGKENHPVVHVTWHDAKAYCAWKKKRLPTEAEWEWAARGGGKSLEFPWGNNSVESGHFANLYQGQFPIRNANLDGFEYTAPVGSFSPNNYQLYDMAGNVWEWCEDYYHADYYTSLAGMTSVNPKGPLESWDPEEPGIVKRVVRGGSFLCNSSYCSGYKITRRMKSEENSSMEHTGFRCACDQ